MANSQVYVKGNVVPAFNMTPMIDVTFQLIIFFILAGTIGAQELAELVLHKPKASQAVKEEKMPAGNRVIVNITSAATKETDIGGVASQAKEISLGPLKLRPDQRGQLTEALRQRKAAWSATAPPDKKNEFYIEIRADFRVSYEQVEPVMLAAAEAEIPKMGITALVQQPSDKD